MKWDEFAFVNQQLAGMLKTGIPLEGALRRLCETMRHGRWRTELELLQADLANIQLQITLLFDLQTAPNGSAALRDRLAAIRQLTWSP